MTMLPNVEKTMVTVTLAVLVGSGGRGDCSD